MRGRELGAVAALVALGAAAGLAALAPAGDGAGGEAHAEPGGEPGMIVVADRGNNRLQAFYPDGTFAFKFGAGFGYANSIDVGSDGMIVADGGDWIGGVHAFHPDGSYAFEVAGNGEGVGLVGFAKVAVAPDGRIVTVDSSRVQVFEPDGTFVSVFETSPEVRPVWGVDVAPDGRIVVGDRSDGYTYAKGHVKVFHLNGTLALSFVVDAGEYYIVRDLAVGPDGRIVVTGDYSINIYQPLPNGTFVHLPLNGTSYQPGPNGTLMAVPGIEAFYAGSISHVAVGPDGRIVVGDGGHHVGVFHPNGSHALTFGGYGSVQSGFDRPTDAAVGPDGRIVVAEPGNRTISVFHPNGTRAFSFGSYGHGDDGFYEPHQVAVGPDGQIIVGDTRKHRILVFEPDGTPALAFGSAGHGAGQIRDVRDVAVGPDGSVVVVDKSCDRNWARVQVFSPDGSSVYELVGAEQVSSGSYWCPARAAVGPDGRIVVAGDYGVVRAYHPDGIEIFTIQLDWGATDGVAVGPDGRIVVVKGHRSQVFHPDGTFAFATEIDVQAVSVAVGPNREVVVVDDRDDRVQVFHPNGTFAFGLLPDLSEGKFNIVGPVAVGPVMPRAIADPAPLVVTLVPVHPRVGPDPDPDPCAGGGDGDCLPPTPPVDPTAGNFTALGDDAELLINVTSLAGGRTLDGSESSTVTFPSNQLSHVTASFGSVLFPPGVTASHVPADGLLSLRVTSDVPIPERMQEALGGNGSEQVIVLVQRVVEVGSVDSRITFDQPIRISLEGQAGGRAFYIDGANGTIMPIDEQCPSGGGPDGVDERLGGASECYLDSVEGDKIIWTYHLTRFGTASVEGPAPAPVFFAGGGGGGGGMQVPVGADNSTGEPDAVTPPPPPPPEPEVVPGPAPAAPAPATCSVALRSPDLSANAQPGGYSQAVRQELINSGTLAFARVELEATPWRDAAAGAPAPAAWPSGPPPAVPAPISGPNVGRAASVLTLNAVVVPSLLPASATEVSEQADGAGGYAALAEGMTVAGGLEGGGTAPLWFRLNLAAQGGGLQAGTSLTQSVTYQVECAAPSP